MWGQRQGRVTYRIMSFRRHTDPEAARKAMEEAVNEVPAPCLPGSTEAASAPHRGISLLHTQPRQCCQ